MLRLLDKKEIDQQKAIEQKRRNDEAVKLAKRINGLRELSAETETIYEKYRTSTLQQVQAEIDERVRERDELDTLLLRLRKERERLEKPVDLTEAWDKVAADFEEVGKQARILEKEKEAVSQRESVVSSKENDLSTRESAIEDQEKIAAKSLNEAHRREQSALQALQEAQNRLLEADTDINDRYTVLSGKEAEMGAREQAVFARENRIAKAEKDIINQNKFLADQRATLERAMNRIQNGRQRTDR